jgi:hypothetical protein
MNRTFPEREAVPILETAITLYRQLFCTVIDLKVIGHGVPHLLIGCAGVWNLVECKTPDEPISAVQALFRKESRGATITIVREEKDIIAHVQRIRALQATGR